MCQLHQLSWANIFPVVLRGGGAVVMCHAVVLVVVEYDRHHQSEERMAASTGTAVIYRDGGGCNLSNVSEFFPALQETFSQL